MSIDLIFLLVLVYAALLLGARSEPVEDKQALLDFIQSSTHSRKLNWDETTSACSIWAGVTCNHDNSTVIALRLPAIGLSGSIPTDTLSRLYGLQILSLRSNSLSGAFPSDLLKLGNLTSLYLQDNNFQGALPSDFSLWKNLSVLNLSNNHFNGSIPSSVSNLTHLTVWNLANNSLSGHIPDINIPGLQVLDLSNNNLTGIVPPSLLRFPSSDFSGNNVTFENSLPPSPPQAAPPRKHWHLSEPAILGIVIVGSIIVFVLISVLLIATKRKKHVDDDVSTNSSALRKKEKSKRKMVSDPPDRNTKVTFIDGDHNLAFDLEDLLRASAEVLGKGTYGTTYKAALEDASTVVVKRLKESTISRKEFEQLMDVVGNIRHENVAPLRAYYYSKDEKLMVYDYYNQGSVSALLHVKQNESQMTLDWESRLKIAIGAARGIDQIHSQSAGKLIHGNIKASNIFLNSEQYGCVCDLGLAALIPNAARRAPGYRAPEISDNRKASQASDVYSFGVFLLELLSGKSPVAAAGGEEVVHLVRWVQSVVREEWTGEVFDIELLRYPNIEEEMVRMLQIGLSCVDTVPGQRPKMGQVVKMLEDLTTVDVEDHQSATTKSPDITPAPLGGYPGPSSSGPGSSC